MPSAAQSIEGDPLGLVSIPSAIWHGLQAPTVTSVSMYLGFLTWIVLCAKYLPGQDVLGVVLPNKKPRVKYRLNGLLMAIVTWSAYLIGSYGLKLFPATIIIDNIAPLSSTVLIFVLAFSTYLYVSGKRHQTTTGEKDDEEAGGFLHEFWVGVQLNPSIFGLDVKFLALKIALIGWILINISFAAEQYRIYGMIGDRMVFYQLFTLVYSVDYYYFEQAMLSTWDIISEHFGLMLVFGDLWFMWFAFSVQPWYLLHDTSKISPFWQMALVAFFSLGYWIFRSANSQKNQFKLNPKAPIWGETPKTIGGKILISGWWGILRKANYTGDWIIAICFSLPCGFNYAFAFWYPFYLISLGIHRAMRDDAKCAKKYKEDWAEYKRLVPYAAIPGIF